jgi:tetratricopeptide (TPR) repeat protein
MGLAVGAIASAAVLSLHNRQTPQNVATDGYVGSSSCRSCHEKFYQLWSTSHHGLAMQLYSPEFVRSAQLSDSPAVRIGEFTYKAEITDKGGWIVEQGGGGDERRYSIEQALGGKNVYYFLTPLERGHLQVLPLAFDMRTKTWMDATLSMTMHENVPHGQPVTWRDRTLTFNTSCYGCHVSQIETNYDPANDSYQTTWREPGINCETCHGPAGKHVRLYQTAEKNGETPDELGLISFKSLTPQQRSDACASCHAKISAITSGFHVGDKFFDNFNLVTYESPDFHPDGRDLGENYTFTSWMMSPCTKSGKLNCVSCHTSSGRYRFAKGDPNAACLPCHAELVTNATVHSHHSADNAGNHCVSCHMPMTEYARMRRSDHSMRPPTPATTIKYKSPNACNDCHKDKGAHWADTLVRQWYPKDYQAPILAQAALIDAARRHDWSQLPAMLAYIQDSDHNTIVAASLIRLLGACRDSRKFVAMQTALKDPSPLVRANAVDVLAEHLDMPTAQAVVPYTKDESRLVRLRAAAALSQVPPNAFDEATRATIQPATQEYIASLTNRQDDFAQHLNMGNFRGNRGELQEAVGEYEKAALLRPDFAPALVNAAVIYSQLGDMPKAEGALRRAIAADPKEPAAHFNLGLLLAETGHHGEAEKELRTAVQLDGSNAAAAYDLAVLVGNKSPADALALCKKAAALDRENPKYSNAVEYYRKLAAREDSVKTPEAEKPQ